MCGSFNRKEGLGGFLPSELLDGVKAALEQSESRFVVVVETMAWLRLVNKHWSSWATRATTALKPGVCRFPGEMVVKKFVNTNTMILRQECDMIGYLLENLCQFSSLTSLFLVTTDRGWERRVMSVDQIKNITSLTSLTRLSVHWIEGEGGMRV